MAEFDVYLGNTPEPQRSTLQSMRERICALYPDAEECQAYGVPAFRLDGITFAGLAARRNGCSYYPMSGSLLDDFDLGALGLTRSKGALHFPADTPLPDDLLRALIAARLAMGS